MSPESEYAIKVKELIKQLQRVDREEWSMSSWWIDFPNNFKPSPETLPNRAAPWPESWHREDGTLKYTFENKWFMVHMPFWAESIVPWANARRDEVARPLLFLEIGCYEGQATVWMLEFLMAEDDKLFCVDPWDFDRAEGWQRIHKQFDVNLAASGQEKETFIMQKLSAHVLPRGRRESFDFIYVDGDHTEESVYFDTIASVRLLAQGGLIVWDDYYCPILAEREAVRAGWDRAARELGIKRHKLGHHLVWIKPAERDVDHD